MDLRGTRTVKFQRKAYPSIAKVLASAVSEWLLILLLFLDAGFSYLVTSFARYCHLQIPCLLCSRLDHVLGNARVGFYWDLVCQKHKLKMSSLVCCHVHGNLVDVHGTCESCFFSLATQNKSNAETYRLLVGKLGAEPHYGLDEGSLSWEYNRGSSETRQCSCCNEKWISTSNAEKLFQTKSMNSEEAELEPPLYEASAPKRHEFKEINNASSHFQHLGKSNAVPLSHVEYSKINDASDIESEKPSSDDESSRALIRERESPHKDLVAKYPQQKPPVIAHADNKEADPLSHLEYSKVNVTSDNESENPSSDDESSRALIHERVSPDKDLAAKYPQPKPPVIAHADNEVANPLSHVDYSKVNVTSDNESENPSSDDESSSALIREMESPEKDLAAKYVQPESPTTSVSKDAVPPDNLINLASSTRRSLLESEMQLEANNPCCNTRSESPNGHHGLKELNWQQVDRKNDDFTLPEHINFNDVLQMPTVSRTKSYVSKETDAKAMAELEREVTIEHGETSGRKVTPLQQTVTNSLDLSDAYKLAVGNKGRQLSGRLLEQQKSIKDSERASEDVKLLLSQITSRGTETSLNDVSPRMSANSDDFRTFDSSSTIGMQILQRRISLERNESNISLDGSTVSEIEGEGTIDRLTRQVEHDKKIIGALYKELEEERNASTVAANQAMAMITRLQEEKAALYMEALQCLRMTEEKAEYEGEALQKANQLLAEKEKVIQDLEAELELYKSKLGDASSPSNFLMRSPESGAGKSKVANNSAAFKSSNDDKLDIAKRIVEALKLFGDKDTNTSVEVEDEKQYIMRCLKQLEEKFYLFSKDEVDPEMTDGTFTEEERNGVCGTK